MELPLPKHPRIDQQVCPHCNEIVSYKTYKTHKRLHYDCGTDTWHQQTPLESPQDSIGPDLPLLDLGSDCEFNYCDDEESPPCSEPALSDDETEMDNESEFYHIYIGQKGC